MQWESDKNKTEQRAVRTNVGASMNRTKAREREKKDNHRIYWYNKCIENGEANNNNKRIKKEEEKTIRWSWSTRCVVYSATLYTFTSSCEFSIQFITAKYYPIRRKVKRKDFRSVCNASVCTLALMPPIRKSNSFINVCITSSTSTSTSNSESTHLIYQTIISIHIISSKFDSNTHAHKQTRFDSNQTHGNGNTNSNDDGNNRHV